MWIYEKNTEDTARFLLGEEGQRMVICIGVNPNTAKPFELDQTAKQVRNIAYKKGYDGWLLINLYPQRARDPKNLHNDINESLLNENISIINEYLLSKQPVDVWLGWGVPIEERDYLKRCVKELHKIFSSYNPNWLALGKPTKNGHPKHPSRASHSADLAPFDIEKYIDTYCA